jgi:hypothetical protein
VLARPDFGWVADATRGGRRFGATASSIHDHIFWAMSTHQLLLTILFYSPTKSSTWFAFSDLVLDGIKYCLGYHSLYDKIEDSQSTVSQQQLGVPQSSLPGTLLFTLYTTLRSTFISKPCVHHYLYANDAQLFISFTSSEFLNIFKNIFILESTITAICS